MARKCDRCGIEPFDDPEAINELLVFGIVSVYSCFKCKTAWQLFARKDPDCQEYWKLQSEQEILKDISLHTKDAEEIIQRYINCGVKQNELEIQIIKKAQKFYEDANA